MKRFAPTMRPPFAPLSLIGALSRLPDLRPIADLRLTDDGLLVAPMFHGMYLGRSQVLPLCHSVAHGHGEKHRSFLDDDPRNVPSQSRQRFDIDATLFLTPQVGLQVSAGTGRSRFIGVSLIIR